MVKLLCQALFFSIVSENNVCYIPLIQLVPTLLPVPYYMLQPLHRLASEIFQGAFPRSGFSEDAFSGDLRNKFYSADKANGTPGTYTRDTNSETWIRQ
jgi:hypothetical protein